MNKQAMLIYTLALFVFIEAVLLITLTVLNTRIAHDDRLQAELYKACTAQLMWIEIKHNEPLDY